MAASDSTLYTPLELSAIGAHFFKNLAGQRFGRLVAVSPLRRVRDNCICWRCVCDCGNEAIVYGAHLRKGHTASCGCSKGEFIGDRFRRHGLSHTTTHNIWNGLRARCNNQNNGAYGSYGGRGITYDPRWEVFENFLEDMGECPPGMSIDRYPDNDGPYCKSNCRWATKTEQANNRRSSRIVEFRGKTMTVAELARETGVPAGRIHSRLSSGYTVEDAVNSPTHVVRASQKYEYRGQHLTVMELARLSGKNWSTVSKRLKSGMSAEDAVTLPPSKVKGVGPRSRYSPVTGERRWKN